MTVPASGDPLAPVAPLPIEALVRRRSDGDPRPGRWLARRLLLTVVILFVVSLVVFAATQALPSDPAQAILGRDATPARLAALRAQLGLGRPVLEQYTSWLGGVVTGDLGSSLSTRAPVADTVGPAFVNSLVLLVISALVALPLAIVLGAITAVRRDSVGDRIAVGAALVLGAVPEFVIGIVLTIVFATTVFTVLPAVALFPVGDSPLRHLTTLVLPVVTLVLAVVPYVFRLTRASMLEILQSDYVQMARLKGVPERLILRRHALPNALVPTIQASALVMAYLLSGVVVVEYLFRYPGLGSALADAIDNRDLPLIQAIVMVYAVAVALFNLLADVLTTLVSPRLRQELR